MKKIAIINQGQSNRGKSTTILQIYAALKHKYQPTENPTSTNSRNNEITAILQIDGIKIGIESEGDPYTNYEISLKKFIEASCNIIIATCRTKGATAASMRKLKDNGYSVIWTTNPRSDDEILIDKLNQKYVDMIIEIVDEYKLNNFQ